MRKIAGVELWGNVAWSGQRGKVGLEKLKNVVNMIYGIFFLNLSVNTLTG